MTKGIQKVPVEPAVGAPGGATALFTNKPAPLAGVVTVAPETSVAGQTCVELPFALSLLNLTFSVTERDLTLSLSP